MTTAGTRAVVDTDIMHFSIHHLLILCSGQIFVSTFQRFSHIFFKSTSYVREQSKKVKKPKIKCFMSHAIA